MKLKNILNEREDMIGNIEIGEISFSAGNDKDIIYVHARNLSFNTESSWEMSSHFYDKMQKAFMTKHNIEKFDYNDKEMKKSQYEFFKNNKDIDLHQKLISEFEAELKESYHLYYQYLIARYHIFAQKKEELRAAIEKEKNNEA